MLFCYFHLLLFSIYIVIYFFFIATYFSSFYVNFSMIFFCLFYQYKNSLALYLFILKQDKLWQCFLTNADSAKTEPKSVSHLDNLGMDSAKLQCCFRAATLTCQRLCIKVKPNHNRCVLFSSFVLLHMYEFRQKKRKVLK